MRKARRTVVWLFAAALLVMLLFPPFHIVGAAAQMNAGYGFILDPPNAAASVNTGLLLVQALLVSAMAAALYLFPPAAWEREERYLRPTDEALETITAAVARGQVLRVTWASVKLCARPNGDPIEKLPRDAQVLLVRRERDWMEVVPAGRSLLGWVPLDSAN